MRRIFSYSQEADPDRKPSSDVSDSVPESALTTLPEAGNRHLSIPFPLPKTNSLDDRLAFESELVQFVLSESEAAFTGPTHHFFIPGGQQLLYNQN